VHGLHAATDANIPPERATFIRPVLFLVGGEDYINRKENAFAIAEQGKKEGWLPDVEAKVFEDCGHWLQLEQPEKLFQELKNFENRLNK
jgi:soluble epoxide hydrolase / lipid-phosphate phosphatase